MHPRDALYYAMTGDTFDGRRAAEIKFVNKSVPLADPEIRNAQAGGKIDLQGSSMRSAPARTVTVTRLR